MKLEIKNLSKSYGKKKILDNVSFTFDSNKIYGIVGRNGVGKTTFFEVLNYDTPYDDGSIKLDNEELDEKVSLIPATPNVPPFLTGREFISFFLELNKDKIKDKKSIDEYFKMIDMPLSDQNKIMKNYSTGMKNKIETLLGIISEKEVLLLDEPLTSLDIVVQEEMKKLLKSVKKDRIIIVTTHILDIALDLCDEIIILKDKKFEVISSKDLEKKAYRDTIIKALKDKSND
jgi:ABC-2 type transport system ATP-binding protein